ncbi:hypothetical protein ACOXVJ_04740 [Pseudomonas knackmussii]|uniref:hypothetical protein n=1 Tax=Pseudomonas knackmussii TaxID=65741 RepID=UPI003BE48228
MSRLNKFKKFLTQEEAAALLGLLINESVSTNEIERLRIEWSIDRAVEVPHGKLVRLEPVNPTGMSDHSVDTLRPMRAVEVAGDCYGFTYPCETVTIGDDVQVCALQGESGAYYAVAEIPSGELLTLSDDEFPGFESKLVDPTDIYRIAAIANDDTATKPYEISPKLNTWAACDENIYNFLAGEEPPKPAPPKLKLVKQTNSQLLAIYSLLDIAIEKSGRNCTQDALIDEILKRADGKRGLSESGLQKLFAAAKNAARDWME